MQAGGYGIASSIVGLIGAIIVVVGLFYFIFFPIYALLKLSAAWKTRNITILFAAYFVSLIGFGLLFWYDVFVTNHQFGGIYRPSSIILFLLPLIYLGTTWFLNRFHRK